MSVCGNSFKEALEYEFRASSGKVMEDALNIKYPLDDMLRIIALYLRYNVDPLIDIDAFVADGHKIGVDKIIKRLEAIKEELEKGE